MSRYQLIKWDEYHPTNRTEGGFQIRIVGYEKDRTIICGPHAVELSKEYAYRQGKGDDS